MKKLFSPALCAVLLCCCLQSLASSEANEHHQPALINLVEVLANTLKLHPKALALSTKIDEQSANVLSAQGAFDWTYQQEIQNRTSGFYDGWYSDGRVVKQLPWAQAKIQTGYRISGGDFPVYEQYHRTLEDGEPNLKLSVSLLQNRSTDPKRQALEAAHLGLAEQEASRSVGLNQLLLDAANYFLDWHQARQEVDIAGELVALARARSIAIEQRVSSGDIAPIIKTEFQATLLDRQASFLALEQQLLKSQLNLSLYFRNQLGSPIELTSASRPLLSDHLQAELDVHVNNLSDNFQSHPLIAAMELQRQQLQSELKLAKNQLLPTLDLDILLAQDLGAGSSTLEDTESYVGFRFEAPLERRKAQGKTNALNAKLRMLALEQQQTLEYMALNLEQQMLALTNQKQLLTLQRQQVELVQALAEAEDLRFKAGDSDLFLLNTRETDSARAKLKAVKIQNYIIRQQLQLLAQTAKLENVTQQLLAKPN